MVLKKRLQKENGRLKLFSKIKTAMGYALFFFEDLQIAHLITHLSVRYHFVFTINIKQFLFMPY